MRAIVAARGFIPVTPPATPGAKDDACDHQNNDYDRNRKEHSHPNSPFSGFPESWPNLTFARSLGTTRAGSPRTVPTPLCRCAFMRDPGGFETRPRFTCGLAHACRRGRILYGKPIE